jgi:osmotically-inducible protein OsmY
MVSSEQIEADILMEIREDKRIPEPDEIAVKAVDGSVTLRGTVGSFAQRRAAVKDARNTEGVFDVYDELKVRILDGYGRDDAEIRGTALQLLMWDVEIPSDSIEVSVLDGWLTLKGDVDFQFQSDDAFEDVASLYGLVGITNEIRVGELL